MNIFEKLRRLTDSARVRGHKIEEIVADSTWVVRGGVFLVEYQEKFYILINKQDLMHAIAGLGALEQASLQESIFGIPLWEDSYKALRIMCGVFHVDYNNVALPERNKKRTTLSSSS